MSWKSQSHPRAGREMTNYEDSWIHKRWKDNLPLGWMSPSDFCQHVQYPSLHTQSVDNMTIILLIMSSLNCEQPRFLILKYKENASGIYSYLQVCVTWLNGKEVYQRQNEAQVNIHCHLLHKQVYIPGGKWVSEYYHSLVNVFTYFTAYVDGSSKMSHDLSSIKLEVYSNGKISRLLKLVFFIHKCAGILLTSIYMTQLVLATPTLICTWYYEYN